MEYHPIIVAFAEMNLSAIDALLENNHFYNSVPKKTFMITLEKVFARFKNEGNKSLIPVSGRCDNKSCNNGKDEGFAFLGDTSDHHLDLIFKISGNVVVNITQCYSFCAKRANRKDKALILEDNIDVFKNIEYIEAALELESMAKIAVNQLKRYRDDQDCLKLAYAEYWQTEHYLTDYNFKIISDPNKQVITEFMNLFKLIDLFLEFKNAIPDYTKNLHLRINDQKALTNWLLDNELKILWLIHPDNLLKADDNNPNAFKLKTSFPLYVFKHEFEDLQRLQTILNAIYTATLLKVKNISDEEFKQRAILEGPNSEIYQISYYLEKNIRDLFSHTENLLLGLAVGDALGVPVEFMSREELQSNPVTGMRAFGTHAQEAGTWSDDSSMAFCLAENIVDGYDIEKLAQAFIKWYDHGHWTATGHMFDVGITCYNAIDRLKNNCSPYESGDADEYSNGNGALMRIAPLVFFVYDKKAKERVRIIKEVAGITHQHPRSHVACIYLIEFLIELMTRTPASDAVDLLRSKFPRFIANHYPEGKAELIHFKRLLKGKISELPIEEIRSSGYVVDTLEASIWCILNNKNYASSVLQAVNLGSDTDTTAAVTGAIAGLIYGKNNIPYEWLSVLKRYEDIEDLAGDLNTVTFCFNAKDMEAIREHSAKVNKNKEQNGEA